MCLFTSNKLYTHEISINFKNISTDMNKFCDSPAMNAGRGMCQLKKCTHMQSSFEQVQTNRQCIIGHSILQIKNPVIYR
jgi:hypothetical protein